MTSGKVSRLIRNPPKNNKTWSVLSSKFFVNIFADFLQKRFCSRTDSPKLNFVVFSKTSEDTMKHQDNKIMSLASAYHMRIEKLRRTL